MTSYLTIPPAVSWTSANGATSTTLASWQYNRVGPPQTCPWFVPMAGYFQRWPPSWDTSTYRGITQATIADGWAYTNRQLKSCLRQEILSDNPYAYWPLTDAEHDITGINNPAATNIAPLNSNVLVVTRSKNGAASATATFGANSGGLPGDQTTTVTTSQRAQSSPGMWQEQGVTDSTKG